jgi:hypothetical protein
MTQSTYWMTVSVIVAGLGLQLPTSPPALSETAMPTVGDECGVLPRAKFSIDGRKATKQQLRAAERDVVAFMAASDFYQTCVLRYSKQYEANLSNDDKQRLLALVEESQKAKETVGNDYNAAVDDFSKSHK